MMLHFDEFLWHFDEFCGMLMKFVQFDEFCENQPSGSNPPFWLKLKGEKLADFRGL